MYINKVTNELIEDNNVVLMFANVSFPNGVLDEAFLAKQNIVKVEYEAQPVIDDFTQYVEQDKFATLENGVYIIKYRVLPKTEVEIVEYRKSQVPQSITPLQAKLQLLKLGLLDEVEALVTGDRTAQLYWEYASVVERDNAVLLLMANSIGLTSEQVDEMFMEASKL